MSQLIVKKFGGSSLGSIEKIQKVASIIKAEYDKNIKMIVVVSAMSGETDRLNQLVKDTDSDYRGRELDAVLSTGEQVSAALLAVALQKEGINAVSMTGAQSGITTNNAYNRARITSIDPKVLKQQLNKGHIIIVTGFQGTDNDGNTTTLGRGGSDTTAVALAAKMEADECQIYTDVDGVYTTDPRIEPQARRLAQITFEEMLEMASLGSKVLQIRAVELAGKYNVPLRVLSTFKPGGGTLITYENEGNTLEHQKIAGIAINQDEAQLTIRGVPDHPGIAAQILCPVADADIEVDMIVQNVGSRDGSADFTFTVHRRDYKRAKEILEKHAAEIGQCRVRGDDSIVKISLVGVGMRSHAGIASMMFDTLAKASVDIRMISTSEIKISVVIKEEKMEEAVKALHDAFELDKEQH